jgi:hypothetical protein
MNLLNLPDWNVEQVEDSKVADEKASEEERRQMAAVLLTEFRAMRGRTS